MGREGEGKRRVEGRRESRSLPSGRKDTTATVHSHRHETISISVFSPFPSYFSISGFCSCPWFFILSSKRWPFFPLFTIDVSVVLLLFFFPVADSSGTSFWVTWRVKRSFSSLSLFFSLIFQSIAKFSDNDLNIIFGRNFLETHLLRASVRSSTKKRDGKRLEISSVVVIFRGSRTIQLPRDDQRRG